MSISLLMSSILGGSGDRQKYSNFRSKFVYDCVSWRLNSLLFQNCFYLPGLVEYFLF